MATNTSNYGLVKPAQDDFYNIDVQNGNMDIIDEELKNSKDQIETLSSEKETLENTTNEHLANKENPHSVTKAQVGLGSVPNVSTNNQTPSYTEASSLTELTSGEKLSVAFGKLKKAVSSLISHLANKSNPHGVTSAQVGAVPLDGSTAMTGGRLKLGNGYAEIEALTGSVFLKSMQTAGDTDNARYIRIRNKGQNEDISESLHFIDKVDGKHNTYEIYGSHNKPTAAELGFAEATTHNVKTYTHPSQFGSSADATCAEIYKALPLNSIAILRPAHLTDSSWMFNDLFVFSDGTCPKYGHVQIQKSESNALGRIFFWGRNASIGSGMKIIDADGNPGGEWVKFTTGNELDALSSTVDSKQDEIVGAASSIVTNDFSNTNAVLVSSSNGKVSSQSGVTKTELQTLQGVTGKIQTQLDAKVDNSKHQMAVYRLMSALGLENSATFAETVAAVPNYSVAYLQVSSLSDDSWNFPDDISYGVVQIIKRYNTEVSIVLLSRVGNAYFATTSTAGVPSGVWNKVIEQNDLDTALASKQDTINGAISNVLQTNFTASRALVSQASGKIGVSAVTSTELGYLDGVTSKVQTQLDAKMPKAGGTFTGTTIAQNTNYKGHCIRNIDVRDSTGVTSQSTNMIRFDRKA